MTFCFFCAYTHGKLDTLSLHDALPISPGEAARLRPRATGVRGADRAGLGRQGGAARPGRAAGRRLCRACAEFGRPHVCSLVNNVTLARPFARNKDEKFSGVTDRFDSTN